VFEALINDEESHFDQFGTEMVNIDQFDEKKLLPGVHIAPLPN
jgi:hypothetical protein